MMRYLKALLLIAFFFVSMLFFVQNTEDLSRTLVIRLSVLSWSYASAELPIYLMILASFAIGAVAACLYFIADKVRGAAQLREAKARIASLEKDVSRLNAPAVIRPSGITLSDPAPLQSDQSGQAPQ
jgi:putative membrane protein